MSVYGCMSVWMYECMGVHVIQYASMDDDIQQYTGVWDSDLPSL